jgi:hypothetical protein
MTANRHPVDELADIRVEIARLKNRETELREELLADGADLEGDSYRARIVEAEQSYPDRARLEQRFGAKAVAECCKHIPVTYVSLVDKTGRKFSPKKLTGNGDRLHG